MSKRHRIIPSSNGATPPAPSERVGIPFTAWVPEGSRQIEISATGRWLTAFGIFVEGQTVSVSPGIPIMTVYQEARRLMLERRLVGVATDETGQKIFHAFPPNFELALLAKPLAVVEGGDDGPVPQTE